MAVCALGLLNRPRFIFTKLRLFPNETAIWKTIILLNKILLHGLLLMKNVVIQQVWSVAGVLLGVIYVAEGAGAINGMVTNGGADANGMIKCLKKYG